MCLLHALKTNGEARLANATEGTELNKPEKALGERTSALSEKAATNAPSCQPPRDQQKHFVHRAPPVVRANRRPDGQKAIPYNPVTVSGWARRRHSD